MSTEVGFEGNNKPVCIAVQKVLIIGLIYNTAIANMLKKSFSGHLKHCWYGLASVVVGRRPLTSYSQKLQSQSQTNLACRICRVRRREIVNFIPPPR